MLKKMLVGAGTMLALLLLVLALPTIVHSLGIHPVFEDARDYTCLANGLC